MGRLSVASVTSQGFNIYYEVIGDGPPLFIHHGTMGGAEGWKIDGYTDDLKDDYKLILIDSRGHGRSDKPHAREDYAGPKLARDVIAVIDDLGLDKVIYWGYSAGARVGYELANVAPERVSSFILGGGSPYAADFTIPVEGDENDPDTVRTAVLAYFGMTPETIPDLYKDYVLSNDFLAIHASLGVRASLDHVLAKMTMPCFLYVGEDDIRLEPTRLTAACLPDATLVTLPGLNHMGALVMKDLVMPHLRKFLDSVEQYRKSHE